MLTDKQSIILSAVVVFGFSLLGMLQILENFVVIGVLSLCFIIVVSNLLMNKDFLDEEFEEDSKE